MPIPDKITQLTGISDDMVADAPLEADAVKSFFKFCGSDAVFVAHNADFDTSFMRKAAERHSLDYNYTLVDTLAIAKSILKDIKDYNDFKHPEKIKEENFKGAKIKKNKVEVSKKIVSNYFLYSF